MATTLKQRIDYDEYDCHHGINRNCCTVGCADAWAEQHCYAEGEDVCFAFGIEYAFDDLMEQIEADLCAIGEKYDAAIGAALAPFAN